MKATNYFDVSIPMSVYVSVFGWSIEQRLRIRKRRTEFELH